MSTNNIKYKSFVVVLDDVAAAYVQQYHAQNPNEYFKQLLQDEKLRQVNHGKPLNATAISNETPDTSGYVREN